MNEDTESSTTRVRSPQSVRGELTQIAGAAFYKISAVDRMPPFLMNIPTESDLWMFVSSTGGLTAGRGNAERCLFSYETVDRLHDARHFSGPMTLIRSETHAASVGPWEPFAIHGDNDPAVQRNLYKSALGDSVIFEEIHTALELSFRYQWRTSDEWGFVRTATLTNESGEPANLAFVDGFRNVQPFGIPLSLSQTASCLTDAYKQNEVRDGIGIFQLTSQILDRPEACEMLRANCAWSIGLREEAILLNEDQIPRFRAGHPVAPEKLITGRRGSFLVASSATLEPQASSTWHLIADVGLGHADVARLIARKPNGNVGRDVERSLQRSTETLWKLIEHADGRQLTNDQSACVHHVANVLFNCMRGGTFVDGYNIPRDDLAGFLSSRNREVAARQRPFLDTQPETIVATSLVSASRSQADADLERLCLEYLPIHFGRRHGDPSRPWNHFSIRTKNEDGSGALYYEGNWRDIFQNWEALCASFPGFLTQVIAKFVNASTPDGFNPYRITKDGIDWEVPEADNPWSGFGYWGDHQIVYLLRLLELSFAVAPKALQEFLGRRIFSYGNVPYCIKSYEDILAHPRDTIVFDRDRDAEIEKRVSELGSDGRLVATSDGTVYHVNLTEKLLVAALAKASNLVVGGGIWLNTQRPEWNDANNALAGNGLSMVTVCHLRRYLTFCRTLFTGSAPTDVSSEVASWLNDITACLAASRPLFENGVNDRQRKELLDQLGRAFSRYREQVYHHGFSGERRSLDDEAVKFCDLAMAALDYTISVNRRSDSLYHSYNLLALSVDKSEAAVKPLHLMLEGQVAILSAGCLSAAAAADLLQNLFDSDMYREDQRSFMLYPAKPLPSFMEKNLVDEGLARKIPLLNELLDAGETSIVNRGSDCAIRFHPDLSQARDVGAALDSLRTNDPRLADAIDRDRASVLAAYETVFGHESFTGRSSSMYGYEGIGCIYWHMVSKLLLAVQEVVLRAQREGEPEAVVARLTDYYHRVRSGLSTEKTPAEYGAFPTDPYSHTPAHAGAQQPGMTGQVKEEILTRFGELGVQVADGKVSFRPILLRRGEFLEQPQDFLVNDEKIALPRNALAFTFCRVPIVYELSDDNLQARVTWRSGAVHDFADAQLDTTTSTALFHRTGEIAHIHILVPISGER